MRTGQHRRTGGPLRERLTKLLLSSAAGTHRRRKPTAGEGQTATQTNATQANATQAKEHSRVDYRHSAASQA